ncbi:hypothetical protein [Virgibacillus pantothenticus]|uniref:hypothetical protein n=1 Tax=Virgibacillus pantothenticus TaxID=1473 RepID=UPI001C2470A6|nr:hypothetical protein [Virgibacillus pantothenticus]MBU8647467.1 hypothetical protein [Virgibacillus pantothenticus]
MLKHHPTSNVKMLSYFDYRYQYALGLDANASDDRICVNTLSNFRCRLVEYELQTGESLFQQEMEALSENRAVFLGLNKSKARMDSSMLDSSCKNMIRIKLIYTVIRNMVRELRNKTDWELPESYLAYLEKSHQNKTIYQTKTTEETSKLQFLIQQAHDLYAFIKGHADVENFRSFEHLARLLKEQSIPTKDGSVMPVEGAKLTSQILQNPSDPDATFRHKAGETHIGHSLNFVEVYDNETDMGLMMHADVKENTYSDAQYGEDFVKNHPLAKEMDTLAVDGACYRQETVKHADELGLEINFSQMTGRAVAEDSIG